MEEPVNDDEVIILPVEIEFEQEGDWQSTIRARTRFLREKAVDLFGEFFVRPALSLSGGVRMNATPTWAHVRGDVEILPGIGAMIVSRELAQRAFAGLQPNRDCDLITDLSARGDRVSTFTDANEILTGIHLIHNEDHGKNIVVGVLDSGYDLTRGYRVHVVDYAEFQPRTKKFTPLVCRDSHQGPNEADWFHGTHVCGRLAGARGIAPAANVCVAIALTGLNADNLPTGTTGQIGRGLEWLVADCNAGQGCDIVNLSIRFASTNEYLRGISRALTNAANRNRLIVCAVGAGSQLHGTVGPVANRKNVLTVGAAELNGKVWRWRGSNLHDSAAHKPELCAPGASTSMATPVVSGIAATLMASDSRWRTASNLRDELIRRRIQIEDIPRNLESGMVCVSEPKKDET